MNFFLFNLFSTLEAMALIVLILAIFKYRIREYFVHSIFASIMMSLTSYTLRFEFNDSSLATIIQIALLVLFFWLTFRIPIYFAFMVAILGSFFYILIQGIVLITGRALNVFTFAQATTSFSTDMYVAQVSSLCVALLISLFLRKKNFGWNYVPFENNKIQLKGINGRFLLIVSLGFASIGLFFSVTINIYVHLIISIITFIIVILLLLYYANKKEVEYHDR
jgi:hypothetical protein